ncbi:Zinc finger CCCH domain-containing protein 28 [Zea mays]|uniref:Zinc finger CCCH domain-containing protein 28 n=1 Tax=Zea mays TaxID=4577 RepID=A0A1D6J748_MAIZE|nr:Zinc finger CCCH domain-containing protein 28 [Zea mays]
MTCRYYHPPPHIQEQLLRSVGVEDPKVKTICRDFTRGKCSRSANECRFLHHSSVEDVAIVCQDFLRGQCNRIACRYSHVVAHPMPPMNHVPMPYPEMVYTSFEYIPTCYSVTFYGNSFFIYSSYFNNNALWRTSQVAFFLPFIHNLSTIGNELANKKNFHF